MPLYGCLMWPVLGLLIGYSLSDLVDGNEYRAENSFIILFLFIKGMVILFMDYIQ